MKPFVLSAFSVVVGSCYLKPIGAEYLGHLKLSIRS